MRPVGAKSRVPVVNAAVRIGAAHAGQKKKSFPCNQSRRAIFNARKKRARHRDAALRPDRKFNEREFSRQSKKDHAIKTRLFAPTGRRIVA
jgi:hypothetical protein